MPPFIRKSGQKYEVVTCIRLDIQYIMCKSTGKKFINHIAAGEPGSFRLTKIFFLFQNETLSPNEEEGILINEFSLVLQNVGHHSIGKYMCMATNDAGKGSSQQVFLDVKCKQYG